MKLFRLRRSSKRQVATMDCRSNNTEDIVQEVNEPEVGRSTKVSSPPNVSSISSMTPGSCDDERKEGYDERVIITALCKSPVFCKLASEGEKIELTDEETVDKSECLVLGDEKMDHVNLSDGGCIDTPHKNLAISISKGTNGDSGVKILERSEVISDIQSTLAFHYGVSVVPQCANPSASVDEADTIKGDTNLFGNDANEKDGTCHGSQTSSFVSNAVNQVDGPSETESGNPNTNVTLTPTLTHEMPAFPRLNTLQLESANSLDQLISASAAVHKIVCQVESSFHLLWKLLSEQLTAKVESTGKNNDGKGGGNRSISTDVARYMGKRFYKRCLVSASGAVIFLLCAYLISAEKKTVTTTNETGSATLANDMLNANDLTEMIQTMRATDHGSFESNFSGVEDRKFKNLLSVVVSALSNDRIIEDLLESVLI